MRKETSTEHGATTGDKDHNRQSEAGRLRRRIPSTDPVAQPWDASATRIARVVWNGWACR
eukprot:756035-Hanusia_phi.AAC.5